MKKIVIEWKGPYKVDYVIANLNDGGSDSSGWSGKDYGLYQIYGGHILGGSNTLLYIGEAAYQTFAQRLGQHKTDWIDKEGDVDIYIGDIFDPKCHSVMDGWDSWIQDIKLAEAILIYKYTPNYNSQNIYTPPDTSEQICIINSGARNRLHDKDIVPDDFKI